MNVRMLIASLCVISPSLIYAQGFTDGEASPGFGFSDYGQSHISTAKQATDAGAYSDETPVVLTGYIKAHIGGEVYLFTDKTGDVSVEIEYDEWPGRSVSPKTKVRLHGELDKDMFGTTVDIEYIEIVQ